MYNCELQIERVIAKLKLFLKDFESERFSIGGVLFVDNRSKDMTADRAKTLMVNDSRWTVVRNQENYGLGGTHKIIFGFARENEFSHVAIVHGDDQANPTELVGMIKESENNNNCTVLGSRFSYGSKLKNYSRNRSIGNRVLNAIYEMILKSRVEDLGSGLNFFDISKFDLGVVNSFDNGFTFNMDLLIYIKDQKIKHNYYPISWKSEDEKSNAGSFGVGWITFWKIIKWSFFGEKMWIAPAKRGKFEIL